MADPVFPRPVYRVITDEDRAAGDGQALSRAKTELDRQYDLFVALYPRGRGAEFVVTGEIRRPS